MSKQGKKVKPTYKQMAFETAVRNPERYKGILLAICEFIGEKLNDEVLLKIVSKLYLEGIVSSENVEIKESSTIESISKQVRDVNKTRKSDGGFPEGYQSRFWTYVRTLSELGFVFAQYNQILKFSKVALMLIRNEIDEQEAFSIQSMKYNRCSPYRNVSNNFNYFKFILKVLQEMEKISYEQFIITTFSQNGNIQEFLDIIKENSFGNSNDVEVFVREKFGTNLKSQTILKDYPDVILRFLVITGFVSIQFKGKVFIYRNKENDDYINELLSINIEISNEEKTIPEKHFKKLESYNEVLLNLVYKYRKQVSENDGLEYAKKVQKIICLYNLTKELIVESIVSIGSKKNIIPAFKYVAEPLKLEFYLSLIIAIKYGNKFAIRPNYKADYMGLPISHAPGNTGDIEVYSNNLYWLIEVTLIRNKTQQLNNETTSVIRHLLEDNKLNKYTSKYLSFVAPVIHQDTSQFYDISLIMNRDRLDSFSIKTYTINEFVEVTLNCKNFEDMKNYSNKIIQNFINSIEIETSKKIARNLKQKNINFQIIMEVTGLNIEEIENL